MAFSESRSELIMELAEEFLSATARAKSRR